MGNLTTHAEGTPVCSFQSNAAVPIESLRAYFTPKQSGSGDPSPSNVRAIEGWTGLEVYLNDMLLPAEYARLEYLNIDSGNWIDSNYVPTVAPKIEAKFQLLTNADADIFGFTNNTSPSFIVDPSNRITWYNRWGATSYTRMNQDINNKIVYCIFGKNTIIDGVAQTTFPDVDWSTNQQSLKIGAARNNSSIMNLYECKIYDGTTLVRNMLPCKRISDGELGLYDLVNNIFYTKSGTGFFTAGREIQRATTIPITFPVLGKNKLNNDPTFWEVGSMDATGGKDNRTTRIRTIDFVDVLPNTTYTISITNGYSFALDEFLSGTHKSYYDWTSNTRVLTTGNNINQLFFIIKKNDESDITPAILEECHIQLELGSTATAYEPYSSNNTVYGGYVDVAKGILHITGVKSIIDETVTVKSFQNRTSYYRMSISNGNYGPPSAGNLSMCFSYLKTGNTESWAGWINAETGTLQLCFPTTYDTQEKALAYLKDNPLEVYYHVNSTDPNYEYPLTPTQLSTLMNSNFIWSSANDTITVDSQLHDSKYIAAAKKRIAANEPHIATTSGDIATFSTDMKAPLRSCKVNFLPVQAGSGDPSPENVREISGWTGCEVYKAGSNILTTLENNKYPLFLPIGTKLVASSLKRNNGSYNQIRYYRQDGTQIDYWTLNTTRDNDRYSRTFTLLEDAYYFGSSALDNDGDILDLKLEFNNYDTNGYTPPSGVKFTLDWTSSAGTVYGGYVDLVSGEVWKTYHKITLDGVTTNCKVNRDYSDGTYIIGGIVYLQPFGLVDNPNNDSKLFCNKMPMITRNANISNLPCIKTISGGNQYLRIYLANASEHTDLDTEQKRIDYCNAYLAENPVDVVYPLVTPTLITTLTPTQLKTLIGTNNIWSNTNGNVEASYWTH